MTGAGGVRMVPAGRVPMVGAVAAFDEDRGLGEIESGTGDFVPFHCTAITDGTRTITPGTTVAFELVAGRLGRLEATAVRPLYGVSAGDGVGAPGGSPPDRPEGTTDPRPAVALGGEEANAESDPGERSKLSPGAGLSPTAAGGGPRGDGGVGSRTPPPPSPWAPVTDAVEPAHASDAVEPGAATDAAASDAAEPLPGGPTATDWPVPDHPPGAVPDEAVPVDPAASWPLGGGEPTPVTGTPVVVDPVPVPGAAGTEPSTVSDGSDVSDVSDESPDSVGEEEPPWPSSAPPDGVPGAEEPVDVPGPAGPAGLGPSEPGEQPDGSLGIRPSFDSAPYTGEVRVGGAPAAPPHAEPRAGPPGFHPDFWSPFARSRVGPPPTWMTPVTRREDDPASEREAEDQDPGSEGR